MKKNTTLPIEFSSLQPKVSYVQQWTSDEWSSSCPQCGGVPHQNGSLPDRFRMWTNANGKNKVMGWCRVCSYVWFPDREKAPSPEEFEKWRREQIERETQKKLEAEKAIRLLRSEKIWEIYHKNLFDWQLGLDTVKSWGISKTYAEYWKIGFVEDYTVYNKADGEYHSPAISMPIWQADGSISNVKVRVLNPRRDGDRFRAIYKTGSARPFVAYRNFSSAECLVVEGEKKAMITAYNLRKLGKDIQVVGMPSKTPDESAIKTLAGFERVYVCLDPDAKLVEKNGVSALGRMIDLIDRRRVSLVNLPAKVDDMINENGLDIVDALKYSKRLEA